MSYYININIFNSVIGYNSLPTRLSELSVSSVRNKSKTDHFHNGSVSRLVTLSDTTLREETGEELSVSFEIKIKIQYNR